MILWGALPLAHGCGASQDASIGAGYASLIAQCEAREQRIEDDTTYRDDAEERVELARAHCDDEKRAYRTAHGLEASDGE